ncbi:MAG: TonB-dependent receptor [Akkermansiaceae bacterium]|nr:TonB-dependent receptor [Akkermansiaceae bacterium]
MKAHPSLRTTWLALTGIGLTFGSGAVIAQDALVDLGELEGLTLSGSKVVGSREGAWDLAGSAAYIDAEQFRESGYTNVNRILSRVPGVYVREEDGYGNFPNISMRGADGTRSEKVTLMEDGILSAPAPYSAPAAYYSPRAARMAGIEILKGSSQIKYGPQTTAGVVNYLSTPVPEDGAPNFYWRSTYGSYNTFLNHLYYGDAVETSNGTFGYLFELFHQQTDGFRDLDGGGDTGFTTYEPMVKFFWEPDTRLEQRFEFKYGHTDLDADETYTGLSEADYAANPHRRYAGTLFDNITTRQNRSYLKWIAQPTEDFGFETALYYNDFSRNWYKIRGVDVTNSGDVDFLKGNSAGSTGLRANARDYESYGLQFSGLYEFETGEVEHDLEFGARWHYDQIRRFQRDDTLNSDGSGGQGAFSVTTGAPGSGGNRKQSTEAIALWVSDEIDFGKLAISPGFRYETMDLDYTDFNSDASNTISDQGSGSENYFAPGIGFTYDINEDNKLFGGVFKGYSIPGPRSNVRSGVDKEESLGYELGVRHRNERGVNAELVAFLTDYDNLISTSAGLGLAGNENVGAAEVYGLEALLSYDLGEEKGLGYGIPMYLSATWTSAELKGATLSGGGGEDIYEGGSDGSNIPYIPEWQLAAGIGVDFDKWGVNLDATYVTSTFGTANNFDSPSTDQLQGEIDSVLLFDLTGHYQLTENTKLVGGIHNLTDEEYISSRMPLGARAGAPRSVFGGFEMSF